MQKAWVIHPQDGKTSTGFDIIPGATYECLYNAAMLELSTLMPCLVSSPLVWEVELTGNINKGVFSVTADNTKFQKQYDLNSIIHIVGDDVINDHPNSAQHHSFDVAETIHNSMASVIGLQSLIFQTIDGFHHEYGKSVAEGKAEKYNVWLEQAVRASNPTRPRYTDLLAA